MATQPVLFYAYSLYLIKQQQPFDFEHIVLSLS